MKITIENKNGSKEIIITRQENGLMRVERSETFTFGAFLFIETMDMRLEELDQFLPWLEGAE